MAVKLGGDSGKVAPQMNVTPLVDVVLVLLIIFMIISPMLNKQFYIHLPKQEQEEVERTPPGGDQPIVLALDAEGQATLNGETITADDLAEKLKRVFAARDDHVLFFDGKEGAPYGEAVVLLDRAREGGAVTIAILTDKPEGDEPAKP